MTTLRPIRSEHDYETTLEEIEALWQAEAGTPEADRLDVLIMLVETYEAEHHPIPPPDPIEMILHVMDARGLSRRDMEPYRDTRQGFRNPQPPPTSILGDDSAIAGRAGDTG